jgi:hypothetical protein
MMGGLGLLYMARGLAWIRLSVPLMAPRWTHRRCPCSYCLEYYAILDRIGRGEKP